MILKMAKSMDAASVKGGGGREVPPEKRTFSAEVVRQIGFDPHRSCPFRGQEKRAHSLKKLLEGRQEFAGTRRVNRRTSSLLTRWQRRAPATSRPLG